MHRDSIWEQRLSTPQFLDGVQALVTEPAQSASVKNNVLDEPLTGTLLRGHLCQCPFYPKIRPKIRFLSELFRQFKWGNLQDGQRLRDPEGVSEV